jgi:hypothetical protein
MGKIDYSKAEREMFDALQRMRVKELAEGKSVTSRRAEDFFGLAQDTPRPTPEDPVTKNVCEEAALREAEEVQKKEDAAAAEKVARGEKTPVRASPPAGLPEEEAFEVIKATPMYDVVKKARTQSSRPPQFIAAPTPPPDVLPSDAFREKSSPLYLLRQHILWLKRRHRDDRYELLGTTKEEIMALRAEKRLTDKQLSRVKEIIDRVEEVRAEILAKEGMKTVEEEVEGQKKKQKTKRFNVKETWLPL